MKCFLHLWATFILIVAFVGSGCGEQVVEKVEEPLVHATPKNTVTGAYILIPEMVKVKGGSFLMGTYEYQDEKPTHIVSLNSFSIGKYEVTVEQFRDFMEDTLNNRHYETDAEKARFAIIRPTDINKFVEKSGVTWQCDADGRPRSKIEDKDPVIFVSWNDAMAYCDWLSRITGGKFSLPTEAQWEYAASGGLNHNKYVYSGSDDAAKVAWFDKNSMHLTHPVGQRQPNSLGIYDMSGNAWEWCYDWYSETYYDISPGNNPTGPAKGSKKVVRGGSFLGDVEGCEVTYRNQTFVDDRVCGGGFRVVRNY